MASVIEQLSSDSVARLRLGILPEEGLPVAVDLAGFVLSPFDESEIETASTQVERAADACESWLREGSEATMNRFNSVVRDCG
jgi:PTH1 family peptidyl-tRNA hydrolase